jgi:hypothetical protein
MRGNITLKIDDKLLREVRIMAAKEDTSITALLTRQLENLIRQGKGHDRSRRRALARLEKGWDLGWTPAASRDELHER